jgi:transposase
MEPETFYVYGYYDPKTNDLFYVGKGSGQRDVSHLKPSNWKEPKDTTNPFFYFKIKSLMEKNERPIIKRIAESLTEDKAYQIEHELILEHGRRFVDGGILFNISDNRGGPAKGTRTPWSEERRYSYRKQCFENRVANDREELAEMYLELCMSRKEIAKHYGVSEVLIKKRLQEYDIRKAKEQQKKTRDKVFTKSRKMVECGNCKNQFEVAASHDRKFCSTECSSKSRLEEVVFKGVRYENKYDAAEKTGLSSVYLRVYKDK